MVHKVLSVLLLLYSFDGFARGIKTMSLSESEIAPVRVALGYSTLLQFDGRPTQAIVGDQDSFKVEYVGNSIAIKPLISGVSTNLFVVTEYDKFNFRITAGRGYEPDYTLRIKRKRQEQNHESSGVKTKMLGTSKSASGVTLKVLSIGRTSSALIYSFQLSASGKKLAFQPGDFEILQGGRSLPIENIYLERLTIEKSQRLNGMILIRVENLSGKAPTTIRFRPESLKGGIQIPVSTP